MNNSSLVDCTFLSPNMTPPREHLIDTITIHCTAGQVTAESLGLYFYDERHLCSSNYGVGKDGSIGLYVDEANRSWCSSNAWNDNRAITIEVSSDIDEPYAVTDEAYKSMINLVVDICRRNGIKKLIWSWDKEERVNHVNGCNMTVHRDFAAKACPGTYLYSRMQDIADEVNGELGILDEIDSHYLYKVQLGAFTDRNNAVRLSDELKKLGYETYIIRELK